MEAFEQQEWPVVLPNDGGIRPFGEPDECFYCHARVGEPHGKKCVTVCKRVEYLVRVGGVIDGDDLDGEVIGTFIREDPYFWDAHNCEFHKNESSWCANNAVDNIEWLDTAKAKEVKDSLDGQAEDDCACRLLAFSFHKVIDPGPFRSED